MAWILGKLDCLMDMESSSWAFHGFLNGLPLCHGRVIRLGWCRCFSSFATWVHFKNSSLRLWEFHSNFQTFALAHEQDLLVILYLSLYLFLSLFCPTSTSLDGSDEEVCWHGGAGSTVNRKQLLGLQMSDFPMSEHSSQLCSRADRKGAAGPAGFWHSVYRTVKRTMFC